MATPQPGVFAQGTRSHRHLHFDVPPDAGAGRVLAALAPLRQPSVSAGGANIVIGFGADLWRRIGTDACPDAMAPFAFDGLPATPHDLWVWIHGGGEDDLFDVSFQLNALVSSVGTLAEETSCFVYRDSRDLTGFIDGTENPAVEEAHKVALIPAGEIGAGGSFAFTQRWVHDLAKFHALGEAEQEDVIGRTKADSVELDEGRKPATAHIARVVIEEDEGELEIYRRSVPYGTVGQHGLMFLAFSADPTRITKMLARMYGRTGDGLHDRLTEYTRPVTGATYFVPSLEALGAALG